MYKKIFQPLLFLLPAEKAHKVTTSLLKFLLYIPGVSSLMRWMFWYHQESLSRNFFELKFKNPVGLAAGFDKDARYLKEMAHLGFGFLEIGTVTPRSQTGNPKPRLFRLKQQKGLLNRMGFNNEGADKAAKRLHLFNHRQKRQYNLIIGGNIGKNKTTPNKQAIDDYLAAFEKLFDHVDYFAINVSSPNTPELRALQSKAPLKALLQSIMDANRAMHQPKPLLVKIAPDLEQNELDDILNIVEELGYNGIIATNTTIDRTTLSKSQAETLPQGGISGPMLKDKSTEIVKYIHQKTHGRLPIIAVGGISSSEDARAKMEAGASLVQIYTGLVYEGPGLVKEINQELANN